MRRSRVPSALLVALLVALPVWWGAPSSGSGALAQSSTPEASSAHCPSPLDTLSDAAATPAASPAASAEATPSAEPVCVGVLVTEFEVKPQSTTFRVNQPYIFSVGNAGKIMHEFVIEKFGANDAPLEVEINGKKQESEAEDIAPGETKELAWTFTEPGSYQFTCHVPDHYEAGMVIKVEVLP